MIAIAILFGIGLGAVFMVRRRDTLNRRVQGTNTIFYRRRLKRGDGIVEIIFENEFCKDLQEY